MLGSAFQKVLYYATWDNLRMTLHLSPHTVMGNTGRDASVELLQMF